MFFFSAVSQDTNSCRESKVPEYPTEQSLNNTDIPLGFSSREGDEKLRHHSRERHESDIGDPCDRQLLTPDLDSLHPTFNDIPSDFFFDESLEKLDFKVTNEEQQLPWPSGQDQTQPATDQPQNRSNENGTKMTNHPINSNQPLATKSVPGDCRHIPDDDMVYNAQLVQCNHSYPKLNHPKSTANRQHFIDKLEKNIAHRDPYCDVTNENLTNFQQSNTNQLCQQFRFQEDVIGQYSGDVICAPGKIPPSSKQFISQQAYCKSMQAPANCFSARSNSESNPTYGEEKQFNSVQYQNGKQNIGHATAEQLPQNNNCSCNHPYQNNVNTKPTNPCDKLSQRCSVRFRYPQNYQVPLRSNSDVSEAVYSRSLSTSCDESSLHHQNIYPPDTPKSVPTPDDNFIFRYPSHPVSIPSSARKLSSGNYVISLGGRIKPQ